MNKLKLSRFGIVFLVLSSSIFVTFLNVWSSNQTPIDTQEAAPKVISNLSGFQIVDLERHEDHYSLILKNNYPKNISAFVLSVGHDFQYKEEFAYSETDFLLTSGETFRCEVPLVNSPNSKGIPNITVLAVIFDDKTGEGKSTVIQEIQEERLGEKIQLSRIFPLLEYQLQIFDGDPASLSKLKQTAISSLNKPHQDSLDTLRRFKPLTYKDNQQEGLPEQVVEGLKTGKESVIKKLQYLEDLQYKSDRNFVKEELMRIKDHYYKVIGRL